MRVLCLALVAASCASTSTERPESRALRQLEQDMFAALQAQDLAALEQLLDPAFVLIVPGLPPIDQPAFLESVSAIPGTVLSIEGNDVAVHALGTIGVITGRQVARVELPTGEIAVDDAAFTDLAVLRDGRWLVRVAYSPPANP